MMGSSSNSNLFWKKKSVSVVCQQSRNGATSDSLGTTTTTTTTAAAATQYYSTLLDGPCWKSLQKKFWRNNNGGGRVEAGGASIPRSGGNTVVNDDIGHLRIVTGISKQDGSQVVGMPCTSPAAENLHKPDSPEGDHNGEGLLLTSGDSLAADSVACIPVGVKPDQAAATYSYALTHVHSLFNVVENVGGSRRDVVVMTTPPKHAVVVGGSEDAIRAAQGLQALGSDVTLVSTQASKARQQMIHTSSSSLSSTVTVTDPAMGSRDVGFAEALGTFDAVLDTIGDEQRRWPKGNRDDDIDDDDDRGSSSSSSVLGLLQQRHSCLTYVTTCTQAQQMIAREGVLWGPGKVRKYHDSLKTTAAATNLPFLSAPAKIGNTVQTLLDAGIVWSSPPPIKGGGFFQSNNPTRQQQKKTKELLHIRSWDLSRFMEQTTWPIDNRGAANTRYGFPVIGETSLDDDDDNEGMEVVGSVRIDRPVPVNRNMVRKGMSAVGTEDYDYPGYYDEDDEESSPIQGGHSVKRPLLRVDGVQHLDRIVDNKLDCVLFLSAKFCRTCKKMQLHYNQMVREHTTDKDDSNTPENSNNNNNNLVVFAQGEASGHHGKLLGRALGVDAVPTFILFKNGERYGDPLSITKLPSHKLDKAIEYLKQGKAWDSQILQL